MTLSASQPYTRSEAVPQLVAATGGSLLVGLLYLIMPPHLVVGPNWLALALVVAFSAPALGFLFFAEPGPRHHFIRPFTLTLLVLLTATLVASIILLVVKLAFIQRGLDLLKPAVLLWIINILVFAIWYWEVDGNGPAGRHKLAHEAADFLFPQQNGGNKRHWVPGFLDYLFLAFCTATALSPADTVPLTPRAKMLMMSESIGSMLILVMLIARSINII